MEFIKYSRKSSPQKIPKRNSSCRAIISPSHNRDPTPNEKRFVEDEKIAAADFTLPVANGNVITEAFQR